MAVPEMQAEPTPPAGSHRLRRRLWPRRWRARIGLSSAVVVLAAGSAVWVSREQLAGNFIDQYLADNGIPATFDIVAIGPQVQVIENLVVGDPARPDLTVRRMVVELGVGWAGPEVRRVTVDGARAFGTLRDGQLSLGALDPLIFSDSDEPPALPRTDLMLTDARALVVTEYGNVGLWIAGAGRLDDGFAGTLAATAPGIGVEGCRAEAATLYGKLTTAKGAPALSGPLRLGGLDCAGLTLARADIGTALALKPDFSGAEGDLRLTGSRLAFNDMKGAVLSGTAKATWGASGVVLAHDLALANVTAPQGGLAQLAAEGTWRGAADLGRGEWEGQIRGAGLAPSNALATALAQGTAGLEGTLLAPLTAKARAALTRALSGASFTADALVRHNGPETALIVPEAALTARNGSRVLAASQLSAGITGAGLTALRGNILAGGEGLPNINGRVEQLANGGWALRLVMADYEVGADRVAIPRLTVRQDRSGSLRFDGLATASGALPGGAVRGLVVPLEGAYSAARGLSLGRGCTAVAFDALTVSGLALAGQRITLCPAGSAPILTYDTGLTLGARTGPLVLAGKLGESPARLAADRVVLRYPAPFVVEGLSARIGSAGSEARLTATSLTGSLAGDIGGEFTGGAAQLEAVPLDLSALAGRWRFADGVLRVEEGAFTLTDRPEQGEARFNPLAVRGAVFDFDGETITAEATLRHPRSDKVVALVNILHRLETARGSARLTVPGLAFGTTLQPEDLSYLAKGVVAFADGSVTGVGRIDWTADDVTSSGAFSSESLDFAAAFGPVRGLQGTVEFIDLLNLTTAPDQKVTIAAINPGVEVLAGHVQFELKEGTLLTLEDARFPFMGGTLQMRSLAMDFSQPEERRYTFEIVGLDAATFVTQMELTNLGATGTFDGTVPIIFDENGNGRIEGGLLLSRVPGGNVAYIGDLTYEDLGTMGNYAFEALRSLDYRQMRVGLNGSLSGEIITNFDFDGVRQGQGTSQNFITRRLAKLPIRFKVNVRSENFYELTTMVRSFWDVDFLGNPVDRGLLKTEAGRFVPANPPRSPAAPPQPPSLPPASNPVQPPESDDTPLCNTN